MGVILEIKDNSLIIQGVGTNFADGQPRKLIGSFLEKTIVFSKNKVKYIGSEGLAILDIGMEILIGGAENIRGKTEFKISAINILK